MYTPNQRLWALTDVGAVNFFALQRIVVQQQAQINQLAGVVNDLNRQLNIPAVRQAIATAQHTARTLSSYTNNRRLTS